MAKHRSHGIAFERRVAREYLAGETPHGPAGRHDLPRNLIRIRVAKYEAGAFDGDAHAADLPREYEAGIAALERPVGRQALEIGFLKGASRNVARPRSATTSVTTGPVASPSQGGCRLLMGLPRSTFYDAPAAEADDAEIVARIAALRDGFEAYGYRRVGAALRHRGLVVAGKKIRRLMREHDPRPGRRRRFVATTDGDHDGPIFPDRAEGMVIDGPNRLRVADLT